MKNALRFIKNYAALGADFIVKWWIVAAFSLLGVLASAYMLGLFDGKESEIKASIKQYHKSKGQNASIQSISFWPVASTASDSMRLNAEISRASAVYAQMKTALRFDSWTRTVDSLQKIVDPMAAKVDSIRLAISMASPLPGAYTKCQYVATITTPNSKRTDTLLIILDNKMNVVWPD